MDDSQRLVQRRPAVAADDDVAVAANAENDAAVVDVAVAEQWPHKAWQRRLRLPVRFVGGEPGCVRGTGSTVFCDVLLCAVPVPRRVVWRPTCDR